MYEKGDRNSLEITHTRILCVVSLFGIFSYLFKAQLYYLSVDYLMKDYCALTV